MLRFFRTRTPFFGLLLLVALLITLPGARHPLPLLGLVVFTVLAWRALSRWRRPEREPASFDDDIARSAAEWDRRHAPSEDLEPAPEDEPWRESLRPTNGWRDSADDDEL
jgi:hypothetical protein